MLHVYAACFLLLVVGREVALMVRKALGSFQGLAYSSEPGSGEACQYPTRSLESQRIPERDSGQDNWTILCY